ncbi:MAG: hypothetical protein ACFB03_16695 [Paracoccaceae bacterium]
METTVYTIHHKQGRDLEAVTDRFDIFALAVPLIWAIWHGLWLTLAALAAVMGLAWLFAPAAPVLVMYAVGFVFAFEGGAVRRMELWLWGWQERGVVQAATPEGAEEQFLNGKAA